LSIRKIDNIFREAQVTWDELYPFADRRALQAAQRLGLGGDVRAFARLVDGGRRRTPDRAARLRGVACRAPRLALWNGLRLLPITQWLEGGHRMLLHRKHVLAVLFAVALVAVAVIPLSRQGTAGAQIAAAETGTILFDMRGVGGRPIGTVEFESCEGIGNVMAVNENQGKLVQQPIQVVCKRTGIPLRLLWEKRQQAVTGVSGATFDLFIFLFDSARAIQMTYALKSARVSGLVDTATVGAQVATTATFTAATIEGPIPSVPVNP
jgi:hypothetical protein